MPDSASKQLGTLPATELHPTTDHSGEEAPGPTPSYTLTPRASLPGFSYQRRHSSRADWPGLHSASQLPDELLPMPPSHPPTLSPVAGPASLMDQDARASHMRSMLSIDIGNKGADRGASSFGLGGTRHVLLRGLRLKVGTLLGSSTCCKTAPPAVALVACRPALTRGLSQLSCTAQLPGLTTGVGGGPAAAPAMRSN